MAQAQGWTAGPAPKAPEGWTAGPAPARAPAPVDNWNPASALTKDLAFGDQERQQATLRAVDQLATGAWKQANPVTLFKGLVAATNSPVKTFQNSVFPTKIAIEAWNAAKQGDYLTAARKAVDYAIPVIGPALDPIADRMAAGKESIPEGIGESATLGAMTLAPFGPQTPKAAVTVKPPILKGPVNPVEAAAVEFAQQKGVPLDLATATGRPFIRNVQKKVASSYGGANTADALQTSQAGALTRVGGELAQATGAKVTSPVAAGEGVRAALTKQIQDLHGQATSAYQVLRDAEQANPQRPPTAQGLTALDISQRTPLAVDLTAAVKDLMPLYTQLKRDSELGIPMQGAKGRTLSALDGLMQAPNFAPLSVVDAALSDLKAMARGADMPELRTQGQATAARAVQALDTQVRATAAKAGPNILKALEDGRAATKQKYVVSDVLDLLSDEPKQVFNQLTQNRDVGLARMKAVQQLAPAEMPKVARAFLEDMTDQATTEGGFGHADRLYANWQKLGGETKARLFPKKGQIADLDNFFLLAKKIKENPNPSGTATIPRLNMAEAVAGIPAWALSKILYTPEGVKALTQARILANTPSKAAQTFAVAQLTKAAQSAGVPLDVIPAFADTQTPEAPKKRP